MVYLRRKAILGGLVGGQRKWMILGGAAWFFHWLGRLTGVGDPQPRYTAELKPGERAVLVHEPDSPLKQRKTERKAARTASKQAKRARRARRAARRSGA
jgi:hypothetical protein